jgi:hypothetical protein
MDWGSIILLALAILGAGLMAGVVVAYRLSTRVGVKAFAAASVAVGVTMWAVVAMGAPLSHTGGPSAPVVAVEKING